MNTSQPINITSIRENAIQCLKDEAEALLQLIPQLDENFDKAIQMMYHCKGKVIVTGVGKSGNLVPKSLQLFLQQAPLRSLLTP